MDFWSDTAIRPLAPLVPVAGQRLLLKGAVIVSMDERVGDLPVGDLLIEDNLIAAIGASLPSGDAEVIDMRGMILTPGFVDCHRHAWEAQLKHFNPNSSNLFDYCCATHFSFGPFYDPIDIYAGTMLTAISGIDAGITSFVDNCHNARTNDHAAAALAAWQQSGVRAVYAPGPPLTGDWDEAGWPNGRISALRERMDPRESTPLVTLALMAQFVPEIWSKARAMGLPIVTEVPSADLAGVISQYAADGLLGPDNIFNHITALPASVLDELRQAGVRTNVCPRSDAQYGIADGGMGAYQAALDAGLRPGLSIDNEISYGGDMFREMHAEFFLQRAMTQRDRFESKENVPPPIRVRQVLEAATIDGARCAGIDDRVGSLTPGKEADLIAFRATDLNLYPLNNALGSVVLGADRSNVDTVIVGGRVRKRDGAVIGLDHYILEQLALHSRHRLFAAYGYEPDLFCQEHVELQRSSAEMNRLWR